MKKFTRDIVPIGISVILVFISLYMSFIGGYLLGEKHYIGMIALLVCVILYLINKKIYVFAFAFTLTMGLVGVIDFYYVTFKI